MGISAHISVSRSENKYGEINVTVLVHKNVAAVNRGEFRGIIEKRENHDSIVADQVQVETSRSRSGKNCTVRQFSWLRALGEIRNVKDSGRSNLSFSRLLRARITSSVSR